jgi:transcriptional regulator of heat shock response
MNERQKKLLNLIINEHIQTAEPVGSDFLVAKSGLAVSSATVRNEMADLEKDGFIYQPHISAGRVPTEKGYQFYIDNFVEKREIKATWRKSFDQVLKQKLDKDLILKKLAKNVVEVADQAVIVAFDKNNIFYTGLASLFKKPEFSEQNLICNLSEIIDHLDDRISKIFDSINKVEVLIGSKNPFGADCSAVMGRYFMKDKSTGLFIILGPQRMDYNKNLALVEYIKNSLTKV